jgi:hypothetical protein
MRLSSEVPGKMNEVANEGRTVLFVSHNMMEFRIVQSSYIAGCWAYLDAGKYRSGCAATSEELLTRLGARMEWTYQRRDVTRLSWDKSVFTKLYMVGEDDKPTSSVRFEDILRFQIEFESHFARGFEYFDHQQSAGREHCSFGRDAYEQFFGFAGQNVCPSGIPELY